MIGLVFQSSLERIAELLRIDASLLLRTGLSLVTIWLSAWIANLLLGVLARRIVRVVDDQDARHSSVREKRGQTIAHLLQGVGRVTVFVIALLLSFNLFIDIGPLLAGAGIVGLAISFGAQSLVKDVIAGFFMLAENQFAVGDMIEVAGKSGTVEQMSLRVVTLRDPYGVVHIIPNGQIGVVSNLTRGWARAVVEIGVPWGTDIDRALSVFRDEAARFGADPAWQRRLDGEPEVLGVESMTHAQMVIRTLIRTVPGEQAAAAREFRRRMKLRIDREALKVS
ncbi:MAG TPA: mechanosensitive ion channel family protein [Gemmatimonadales bacterium]|nr:mechanosensitive ion channel family protein [Gemmatimonadales bacterium]